MLTQLVIISAETDNAARSLIINYVLISDMIFDITNIYIFAETAYKIVILLSYIVKFVKV